MQQNIKTLFVLLVVLMGHFQLSFSMEKRLFVNTQSEVYLTRTIDIESLTHGLVTDTMFYSLPQRDKEDIPEIRLLISDSVVYAIEKCRLNVWKWNGQKWINQYKNNNRGLCISDFYLYQNELIGFTSDGFWFSQSAIYVFVESTGGWELRNIKNEVPPFVSSANFSLGTDTIISFVSAIRKNGEVTKSSNAQNFGLDLKTNTWFRTKGEYDLKYFNQFYTGFSFDMEYTFHAFNSDYHLIFDKKSKKIHYLPLEDHFKNVHFYYNDCSHGTVMYKDKVMEWSDEVPSDASYAGLLTFEKLSENEQIENSSGSEVFWVIVSILLLVLGLFLGYKARYILRMFSSSKKPSTLLRDLMENSGQNFTSDEIDSLLRIDDDLNPDSRRVKRSRAIAEINSEYMQLEQKELVLRKKDAKDKRYVIYYIEK